MRDRTTGLNQPVKHYFGTKAADESVTLQNLHMANAGIKTEVAVKHDEGKPDYTLISKELMDTVAQVRAFGAKKYAKNQWKNGFKVTRSLAAAMRHIVAFNSGDTLDPESGLSHLGHAVASLEHAIYDMIHHPENDDRNK